MAMYKILATRLPVLYSALAALGKVFAPMQTAGGKVDLLACQTAEDAARVDLAAPQTQRSAKDVFFPQVETLLKFKTEGQNLSLEQVMPEDTPIYILGVRACDVRSFDILDRVFLADPVDTYYAKRREMTTIIGMACSAPRETCFCHSFGIDATSPASDVVTWLVDGDLYWQAATEKGEALTAKLAQALGDDFALLDGGALTEAGKAIEAQAERTTRALGLLPLHDFVIDPDLYKDEMGAFNSAIWDEISPTCLSCCTCTYICPTCQCYDIRDYSVSETHVERYRCWDSCMAKDFTKMAHGNPRKTRKERFRQRYMHKLVYYPENNDGITMCVGCGRCLAKCPVSLNIVKVAKRLMADKGVRAND